MTEVSSDYMRILPLHYFWTKSASTFSLRNKYDNIKNIILRNKVSQRDERHTL